MNYRKLLLMLLLFIVVPLLPLFGADEAEQRRKVEKLRTANPNHFARLRQETRAFLALPLGRRDQLLKLDTDLHNQSSSAQKHLFEVMYRYADWLERLPANQRRQVLETKDRTQRLRLIRRLREQQWLDSQPKKIRDEVKTLEKARLALVVARTVGQLAVPRNLMPLAGLVAAQRAGRVDPTTEFAAEHIAGAKLKEKKRQQEWRIVARHWSELVEHPPKEGLPNRASHFGKDVEHYVNYYLKHLLSKENWERLKTAEGHWPEYPYLLVELADRHPLALPGPHGIDDVKKLPLEIKEILMKGIPTPKPGPKQMDNLLHKWFKYAENKGAAFGTAVSKFVLFKNLSLPPELWPTLPRDLSPQVQRFATEKLLPLLTRDEAADLKNQEKRWPDYPSKIQELADKYHLQVPWQTLPGPRERWDSYRFKQQAQLDGFPALPLHTLRDFALLELSPQDRAALKLSPNDPTSWQRLTAKYFQEKPGELKRLRQTDVQHLRKHGLIMHK